MCFIDGENLTIRSQAFAEKSGMKLEEGIFYKRDVFLWFPSTQPLDVILHKRSYGSYWKPLRTYYYTSAVGSLEKIHSIKESLWELGFHPEVFKKKNKHDKAKGVDIALAKDFLGNAFRNNYDVAFLFAGDGDYLPLVEEVKRLGKIVCVLFFESEGLNPTLKLAADYFLPIDEVFCDSWKLSKD